MPRVITGKYRGAVLFAPKGDNTRPTTDKVKESLFSMIQMRIPDADVLDLFSGTGQIGIEAISRGANKAVMVEKAGQAISIIRKNFEKIRADVNFGSTSLEASCEPSASGFYLVKGSYNTVLRDLGQKGSKFDVIFMDPPYKMAEEAAKEALDIISEFDMLREDGVFIVEHSSELPFELESYNTDVINLKLKRSCTYGLTVITFFEKK